MASLDQASFVTAPSQPCSRSESCGSLSQLDQHLAQADKSLVKALVSIKQAVHDKASRNKVDSQSNAQRHNTQSNGTNVDSSSSTTAIKKSVNEALRAVNKAQAGLHHKRALKAYKILKAALTNASSLAPNIRLVLAYPRQSDRKLIGGDSIVFLKTMGDRDLFGIIQGKDQVDSKFRLPFGHDNSTGLPYQLYILFILTSDECLLLLKTAGRDANAERALKDDTKHSTGQIRIANPHIEQATLGTKRPMIIYPDVWHISLKGDGNNYPKIDVLLLKRQFSITTITMCEYKRKAADDTGDDRAAKRLRTESSAVQTIHPMDILRNPDNIVQSRPPADITIPQLQDGYTAFINSRSGGQEYQLQRKRLIFRNRMTLVFSCQHSAISTASVPTAPFVAKVQLGTSHSHYGLAAKVWKTEKTMLAKLSHENIVKLMAFDGRLLSLYLEELPPSLIHKEQQLQRPFPSHHTLRILQSISSALAYLATQNVIHYDIKGANIAYSPSYLRGAVLFDFNLARDQNQPAAKGEQGTRWYVPPEFLKQKRGRARDVWALGVTMLDIMGKIEHPESTTDWDLDKAQEGEGEDCERMEKWIEYIEARRQAFNGTKLESLVFRMLHPEVESRIEAAELEAQAAAIELSE